MTEPSSEPQPPPLRAVENAEIAWLFREMADLLGGQTANKFRIRAYRNAARTIEHHPTPVSQLLEGGVKSLTSLPGIGAELAARIREIAETGTFPALETARAQLPTGIRELTRLRGLGAKRAMTLHQRLGVGSIADLERVLAEGKVQQIPGFGDAVVAKLNRELDRARADRGRYRRATTVEYVDAVLAFLGSGDVAVEIAGSFRRRKDTVGDLDFLA